MSDSDDREVERELSLLLYRHLISSAIGQAGLPCLVVWAAYGVAPFQTMMLWLGYMLTIAVVYALLFWLYRDVARHAAQRMKELRRWKLLRNIAQLFSAIGWACTSLLMVPGADVHNVTLMAVLTGVIGQAAMSNTANDMPASAINMLVTVLLASLQLPVVFGKSTLQITVMLLLYTVLLLMSMRNAHVAMRAAIRLRLSYEALARSNAENALRAEQANRDKSEFLAAASHDLRQPVHALLLLIEAFRLQVPSVAKHPLLLTISSAGQSINNLFNALMELSRLQSGAENPVLVQVDVWALMQRVYGRIHPEADKKKLSLRLVQAKSARHVVVTSDKVLLERMLSNLVSNAVRYTDQGGVLLGLRRAHGGGLWLEVWDTGVGITPADQPRIFDPYVQIGNSERDRSKGLGLGLAIVHHAAQLLGLGLTLRSTPGRGSCFRLHLPSQICQAQPPEDQWVLPSASVSGLQLAGRRVLLIDDDPMVLQAMQALLGNWQIDLRCASVGHAVALDVCAQDWIPECVLCDFRLPGSLNGLELLDLALARFPQAVGILLTGELAQSVQALAEEDGYLVLYKPLAPARLASTLSAVLHR